MKLNFVAVMTAAFTITLPFLSDLLVFGTTERGERVFGEPGILIFNAFYAAAPFIFIGLVMKSRKSLDRALWIGFALTALLWAGFAYSGWDYHVSENGGGANIGLGIIMLIWPFIVTVLMATIARFRQAEAP